MDHLVALTLTLVAAVESNCGKNVTHPTVREPSSAHFGQAAVGTYGMMPETLRMLKVDSDEAGAALYARRALKRVRCPYIASVILWERGLNHGLTRASWGQYNAKKRLTRAMLKWTPIKRLKAAGKRFY